MKIKLKGKSKLWVKIVSAVLVVAVITTGVLYATGVIGARANETQTTYSVADLTTGNLQQTISATGSLSAGGSADITAAVDLKIAEYKVSEGTKVSAGDTIATIDVSSLNTTISTLRNDISNLDNTIANLYSAHSSTKTVTSPYAGRVKKIIAAEDDIVKNVISESGALLILSADGKMKVTAALSGEYSVGDSVTVKTGDTTYTGTVAGILSDGKAVVTFTDDGSELDADAAIQNSDGDEIGSGTAAINNPLQVIADAGIISKIYVSENDKISKGTSLFYLKNVPLSEDYHTQVAAREEKLAQLSEAIKLQSTGVITSDIDGIVESVGQSSSSQGMGDSSSQTMSAGDTLLTLYTDGAVSLNVSVDELDIDSVQLDQAASITLDAVSGETFNGTVTHISEVGSNNNGVTTYSVTITLEASDVFRIGMNASATIVIEERTNVLLLPLNALLYSRGEQYVWVYTGSLPSDSSSDPGIKTTVTTGLSSSQYVEVTSGLKETDQVVVVRTVSASDSSSANNNSMGDMGNIIGNMGGDMPSGNMPSGGGNMGGGNFQQRGN